MSILTRIVASVSTTLCAGDARIYHGACDGSGVVALDADFFAVGTDERNLIRVYEATGAGQIVGTLPLDDFLGVEWDEKDGAFKECDIEGATRIGDVTLWITSHGRNSKGKKKPDRWRFFALKIVEHNGPPSLETHGRYYSGLLEDLLEANGLKDWPLEEAAGRRPQEAGGLNIEALCAMPDGGVLVGFRNPIPEGMALLVEIMNPLELVGQGGVHAKFRKARKVDLGGRGFRDIVRWRDGYLILAGAYNDERKFALFRWMGGDDVPELLPIDLNATGISPEGLVFFPGNEAQVLVLSDDDSVMFGGVANNALPDGQRAFRGVYMKLE